MVAIITFALVASMNADRAIVKKVIHQRSDRGNDVNNDAVIGLHQNKDVEHATGSTDGGDLGSGMRRNETGRTRGRKGVDGAARRQCLREDVDNDMDRDTRRRRDGVRDVRREQFARDSRQLANITDFGLLKVSYPVHWLLVSDSWCVLVVVLASEGWLALSAIGESMNSSKVNFDTTQLCYSSNLVPSVGQNQMKSNYSTESEAIFMSLEEDFASVV